MQTVSATIVIRARNTAVDATDEDAAIERTKEWVETVHLAATEILQKAGFEVETKVEYLIAY